MLVSELAWAAGIIDGEGSVYIRLTEPFGRSISPAYTPIVAVAMCHEATIKRLFELFDGNITYREPINEKWLPSWTWWCAGQHRVRAFLEQVKPYLVTKQEHANIMLEALDHWGDGRHVRGLSEEILEIRQEARIQLRGLGRNRGK